MLEMMVASAIIFLVLGMAGALVTDYSKALRNAQPREALLEVIELGAERVASELSGAVAVINPATGTTSTLDFDRMDPNVDRLPNPVPDPVDAWWDYRDPDHVIAVGYSVVGGDLIRDTATATVTSSEMLCQGLSGMSATRVNTRTVRLTFSVDVKGYLQNVVREVHLWVAP